jgi:DNA-binding transcriptional ArsR family regulator
MNRLDDATAGEYARWFHCLANPTRITILHTVATAGRALTVGEIVDTLGKSQSTISKHLQLLAETGFVMCEADGIRTMVRINESCMSDLPEAAALIMATESSIVDHT